jgi:hypothetical protein
MMVFRGDQAKLPGCSKLAALSRHTKEAEISDGKLTATNAMTYLFRHPIVIDASTVFKSPVEDQPLSQLSQTRTPASVLRSMRFLGEGPSGH